MAAAEHLYQHLPAPASSSMKPFLGVEYLKLMINFGP